MARARAAAALLLALGCLPGASAHGAVTRPSPRRLASKPWCPWCVGEHQPQANPWGAVHRDAEPSSPCLGTSRGDRAYTPQEFSHYSGIVQEASGPYAAGEPLAAVIVLDADHNGDARWSFCPHAEAETEECFDREEHLLTPWTDVHSHWGEASTRDHGFDGQHFPQAVPLPASMPPGRVTLRWQWVCKWTDEIFVSCIDVDVVAGDSVPATRPTPAPTGAPTAPTVPTPAATTTCHTAVPGEECHGHAAWAHREGILSEPQWYPGLSPESSFEDFQRHLWRNGLGDCPEPCAAAPMPAPTAAPTAAPTVACHTAVPGEECYGHVAWAHRDGIRSNPQWYPGLSPESSFEDFQRHLWRGGLGECPEPCAAAPTQSCVGEHQQCGGLRWAGPNCCATGLTCAAHSEWYSECERDAYSGPCSEVWRQCGGAGWAGPVCCAPGLRCGALSDHYSQCQPEDAAVMAHGAQHAGPEPEPEAEPEGRLGGAAVMVRVGGHHGGFLANGPALCQATAALLLADRVAAVSSSTLDDDDDDSSVSGSRSGHSGGFAPGRSRGGFAPGRLLLRAGEQ